MSPRELKELTGKILTACVGEYSTAQFVTVETMLLDALCESMPPPGSVEVEIAVAALVDSDGKATGACAIDDETPREFAESEAFDDFDTHRAIVRAWIPPVAPIPVVHGECQ